jgi:hypothetical protein
MALRSDINFACNNSQIEPSSLAVKFVIVIMNNWRLALSAKSHSRKMQIKSSDSET